MIKLIKSIKMIIKKRSVNNVLNTVSDLGVRIINDSSFDSSFYIRRAGDALLCDVLAPGVSD